MRQNKVILALCTLLSCIGLTGCGGHAVQWPSLKHLDDLAERCEALYDQSDLPAMRKIAGEVKTAALTVAHDPMPVDARQPAEVKTLQGDLQSLMDSIHDPATQTGADLVAALAAVHPIVEKLMEAASMPHVHEAEKPQTPPGKDGKS